MRLLAWQVLFWGSVLVLLYSYFLFSRLVSLLARMFGKPPAGADIFPSVTFIVPAHNEAAVIVSKINNILSLDYPADKLSVLVGSDASQDATHDLVQAFKDKRVTLWIAPVRGGKTQIINQCAPLAVSDIIVFTDANTMHDATSLRRMVRWFSDPAVGGVAGRIDHTQASPDSVLPPEEITYRSFEIRLKTSESRLHSCIAAFGGFYAIRRTLFKPIPSNAYSNDDVLIPMNIIRQGFRMAYDNDARSYEDACDSGREEFLRRVRIGAGNFQAFFWLLDFLNPGRGWPFFCYVSHKVCRWFSPFFLITLLLGNAALCLGGSGIFQRVIFIVLWAGIIAALLHRVVPLPKARQAFYFLTMNIALLGGLLRFMRGIRSATWNRTERAHNA
jgi:cellulose synthase/poly-beta-1,6-N-acetylglucosamine synthase-like glycosyltransferase